MQKMPKKYYAFFTLPTLIAFVISFLIPFLLGIYLSFTKFTTVTNSHWVGVSNYVRAFTEDNNFLECNDIYGEVCPGFGGADQSFLRFRLHFFSPAK